MATATLLVPNDLIELSARDGKKYELSEGRLIEVGHAGLLHEMVKSEITAILMAHVARSRCGRVFPESLFPLGPHTARIPDVSFVRREKLKHLVINKKIIPFVPDLAIEVISDSETASESEEKLREYLTGGVEEVWQVYPNLGCVVVSDPRGRRTFEGEQPLLSAVVPELIVRTSDLFTF